MSLSSIVLVVMYLYRFIRSKLHREEQRVSRRISFHFYEDIEHYEAIPFDDRPLPPTPNPNDEEDEYLQPDDHRPGYLWSGHSNHDVQSDNQQHDEQGYLRPVLSNNDTIQPDNLRYDVQGYLKPVPSNHGPIQSKYLTPRLSLTTGGYSTPYDHFQHGERSFRMPNQN